MGKTVKQIVKAIEKPWLKANSAGEAMGIARVSIEEYSSNKWQEKVAQAVIEWNEAQRVELYRRLDALAEKVFNSLQREKLYENWEVRAMTKPGMTPYLVEFYATKKAAVTRRRKEANRVNPPSGLHIVHVVRYKRKRA